MIKVRDMGRKEWELQNKAIRDEKDQLNDYYMQLKHKLDKLHYTEHAAMKVWIVFHYKLLG